MKEIAERAGVSIKTVSRVLNEEKGVAPATRQRVLEVASYLDYRPNALARSLVTKRTRTIGLLIADIGNYFFARIVRGIQDAADQKGYSLLLCDTGENPDTELRCIDLLLSHRVEGLVLSSSRLRDEQIARVGDNTGVVLINRFHPHMRVLTSSIDASAVHLATEHLIQLGHRIIGYIGGPMHSRAAWDREQGYRDVLMRNGIATPIVAAGFPVTIEGGYAAMHWLLDVEPSITGVVAYNDMLAIGAMNAIRTRGRRVPEDVSVVGFDDIEFAAHTNPALTTVSVPIYRLGYEAARVLINAIEASEPVESKEVILPCHLVARASSGIASSSQ